MKGKSIYRSRKTRLKVALGQSVRMLSIIALCIIGVGYAHLLQTLPIWIGLIIFYLAYQYSETSPYIKGKG
ncbi:MAG: hypothetical protein BAJATHORv1_70114 [Candidatus Thorarchaeota archaeon]|nr:MAG: hypothetical protein BAJATHORv1_70114 [Candidatus Thorarchaeota archaeon]